MYIDILSNMHKNLPAGPSSRLSFRCKAVSFVRADIWDGTELLSLFELRYKVVSNDKEDS